MSHFGITLLRRPREGGDPVNAGAFCEALRRPQRFFSSLTAYWMPAFAGMTPEGFVVTR